MQKILLLEDDTTLGNGIRLALQSPSVQITPCRTLAQAQNTLAQNSYARFSGSWSSLPSSLTMIAALSSHG